MVTTVGLKARNILSPLYAKISTRFGNAFAISIALCFKTSVGVAYIQYVWRTLSRESLRLKTVNDSFELSTNLWAFMNWEVALRMRLASLVAFIIWSVCLASSETWLTITKGFFLSLHYLPLQRFLWANQLEPLYPRCKFRG